MFRIISIIFPFIYLSYYFNFILLEIIREAHIKLKLVVLVRFGERERRGCFGFFLKGKERSQFSYKKALGLVRKEEEEKNFKERKRGKEKEKKKEKFLLKP